MVVRMHSGNGPHEEMDRRAIACFNQALADVGLVEGDRLRHVLHDYFAWATRTMMSRYHRPQMMYRADCASRSGRGTDSSVGPLLTTSERTTARGMPNQVSPKAQSPNSARRRMT